LATTTTPRQSEAAGRDRFAGIDANDLIRAFRLMHMARRLDDREITLKRQNRILAMIGKSRERPNISALAREFKVARRTIIRDLQELIRRGQLKPDIYPEWEAPLPEEEE